MISQGDRNTILVPMARRGARRERKERWFDEAPWRLPAVLSLIALAALPLTPLLGRFETGGFARQTVAFFMAIGACSMFLAVGLGLWIALRVREGRAILVAAGAAVVGFLWLWLVFDRLIG